MKKKLLLNVFLLLTMTTAMAQNCDLCGTWMGNYKSQEYDETEGGMVYKTFKVFVRINKYGDDYRVRIKSHDVKNPSDVRYWEDCNIVETGDGYLRWYRKIEKRPFYVNGYVDSYTESELYDCVKNVGGVLQFTIMDRHHMRTYDNHGNCVEEEDYYPSTNVLLYKEDLDW